LLKYYVVSVDKGLNI